MKQLILFPYAGAMGMAYYKWVKPLSQYFNVHIVEYIDKGNETTFQDIVSNVLNELSDVLEEEYIFFGHSMGASVMCSVYDQLAKKNMRLPKRVIVSGTKEYNIKITPPSQMTEEEFWDYYVNMGGISDEILENKRVLNIVLNDLKVDLNILYQFEFSEVENYYRCPVDILNGTQDILTSSKEDWEKMLGREVGYYEFEGKHFFIYSQQDAVFEFLKDLA